MKMNSFTLISSAFLLAALSSSAMADQGPKVTFNQDCRWAGADIQGNDIEFSHLNLDINGAQDWIQSRRCEINTEFPGRPNKKLVVSVFKVEGLATLANQGVAIVTVRHNFKNWGWKQEEARAVVPGATPLVAVATAIGTANCGEPVTLKTEILTAARNGNLLQDAATQVSQIQYSYQNCW